VSAAFYSEFNKAKDELQKGAAAVKNEEKKQGSYRFQAPELTSSRCR